MAYINGNEVFFFPQGSADVNVESGKLYQHLVTFTFGYYEGTTGGAGYVGCVAVEITDDNPNPYLTETALKGLRCRGNLATGHVSTNADVPSQQLIINSVDFTEKGIELYRCSLVASGHDLQGFLVLQEQPMYFIGSITDTVTEIPVDVIKVEGEGGENTNITVDQNYNPDSPNAQSGKAVAEAVQESKSYTDQQIASVGTYSESVTVPAYWASMVTEKTATVKALQTEGGKNCVSFVWASDTHIPDNHGTRTNDIGKVMAKMMDNCDIPFAVISGDVGTRASCSDESGLIQYQEQMPKHLAPLWGTDRLLMALGNHDGCWGDSTGYYRHQFPPERMWQVYFRGQALDFRRVFSDDGLYFFVDNIAQKTRFIVLNSQFGGEYAEDENGWAVNNRFSTSCYGQAQLDWLADVALDMPEGYGAVITAHVPPNSSYTVDRMQLIGIINAYCNKTTFEGSYTAGKDGWTNSTVSVNFTEAKGEILGFFAGHVHGDSVDTKSLACPLITILSAGAKANEPYSEPTPSRVSGKDTETSFDVVTINRAIKTIYCTRIGGGEDRVIAYGEPEAPTNLAGTFQFGRLSSSTGGITSASGNGSYPDYAQATVEFIEAKQGDVFRIKGFGDLSDYNTCTYINTQAPQQGGKANAAQSYWSYSYDSATGIVTLVIQSHDTAYIRFSGVPRDESGNPITTTDHIIITKNQEIV